MLKYKLLSFFCCCCFPSIHQAFALLPLPASVEVEEHNYISLTGHGEEASVFPSTSCSH